jgi:hypothetical protein
MGAMLPRVFFQLFGVAAIAHDATRTTVHLLVITGGPITDVLVIVRSSLVRGSDEQAARQSRQEDISK